MLSGVAAIPLLLAKLWSVYPQLFVRPPVRQPIRLSAHALERVSVLVLVCAAFFELVTGLFNVAQSYPWGFFFPDGALRGRLAGGWGDAAARRGEAPGRPHGAEHATATQESGAGRGTGG